MKRFLLLIFIISSSYALSQEKLNGVVQIDMANSTDNSSPGITVKLNDDFLYDGKYLNHYGIGFHDFQDNSSSLNGRNAYVSGYFGVDFFTAGTNRLRLNYNGNIGIGTISPQSKLHIRGAAESLSILKLENATWKCNQETSIEFWNGSHKGVATSRIISKMNNCGDGGENMLFQTQSPSSANPNITEPSTKLIIKADGKVGVGSISSSSWSAKLVVNNSSDYSKIIQLGAEGPTTWFMGIGDQSGNYFHIGENSNKRLSILKSNGNVGIGTTTPDYKLDVCGTIRAKEVKVEEFTCSNASFNGTLAANQITLTTNGHTADFVFQEDYQLRELSEVETYIKTNKHLPDIPSAAAMEEQGVNLAEMNKLLLQKIEELTLYMLQQQKEIDELKLFKNEMTSENKLENNL